MKIKKLLAWAGAFGLVAGFALPAQAVGGTIASINSVTFLTGAISKTADLGVTFSNTDFQAGYFTLDTTTAGCAALPAGLTFTGNFGSGNAAASATDPTLGISGIPARTVAAGDYNLCVVANKASQTDAETAVLTIAGYNPTEFTPQGDSWVTVPFADRIYAKTQEHFLAQNNEYDDDSIHYLPAGETCTINSDDSFGGPALIVEGAGTCTNNAQNAGLGVPIGFNVNFGGETFSSIYLTTNGMLAFDPTVDDYDNSLAETAVGNTASGISALGMDLGFYSYTTPANHTNIWVANDVTVDGKPAFIATWENAGSHGDDNLKADFQIVLMDNGNGNFDAWFNYDRMQVDDQGYSQKELWIDLIGGKQSTNKYFAYDKEFLTVGQCYAVNVNSLLNKDGTSSSDTNPTSALLNADDSVSLFTDNACATAYEPSVDTKYMRAPVSGTNLNYETIPVGWFVYNDSNPADIEILPTEFFPNSDQALIVDGGANQLISQSVNTTVVGRYVLWMTDGVTGGDSRSIESQVEEQAASSPTPIYAYVVPKFTFGSPSVVNSNQATLFTAFGVKLGTIISAKINGIPLEMVSNSDGKIVFRLPALAAGTYDIEAVGINEVVKFTKAVTVGSAPTSSSSGFALGVAKNVIGFAPGSSKLTSKQKNLIKAGVTGLPTASTLVCTGFVSGAGTSSSDKALARKRATNACVYAKSLNSTLVTQVKIGKSSPLGALARKVTLKFAK